MIPIRRVALHFLAGLIHVWTLLSIFALFYFPVFLDSRAAHGALRNPVPWTPIALTLLLCPAYLLLDSLRLRRLVAEHFYQPVRSFVLNLHLWSVFVFWEGTGRVVWDTGPAWAGVLYFTYWAAAIFAVYSAITRLRGLGYLSGCAQILEYLKGRPPAAHILKRDSPGWLPVFGCLTLSLWMTPLMTADRLIWAAIWTVHATFLYKSLSGGARMQHSEGFLRLVNDAKRRIREITADEVRQKQERQERFVFVDVREDSEWAQGRASGAIHLGKGIIERDIETAVPDRSAEVVLYCGGGYRSALAADALRQMGYTNVLSMAGGIKAWRDRGFPVTK